MGITVGTAKSTLQDDHGVRLSAGGPAMTWPVDNEVGRLIRSVADRLPVPQADPARLANDSARRRRQGSLAGTATTAVLLIGAPTSTMVIDGRRPLAATRVTATAPAPAVFPTLHPGQACPATPGRPVSNAYFVGFELGKGPVRMLIANAGDLRRGVVYIAPRTRPTPSGPQGTTPSKTSGTAFPPTRELGPSRPNASMEPGLCPAPCPRGHARSPTPSRNRHHFPKWTSVAPGSTDI
jgi:hypothetical protein